MLGLRRRHSEVTKHEADEQTTSVSPTEKSRKPISLDEIRIVPPSKFHLTSMAFLLGTDPNNIKEEAETLRGKLVENENYRLAVAVVGAGVMLLGATVVLVEENGNTTIEAINVRVPLDVEPDAAPGYRDEVAKRLLRYTGVIAEETPHCPT